MSDFDTIFNARSALLAMFGALGGAVRSVALKTTWRDGMRAVFIGAATSFGFGTLSPHILHFAFGIDIPADVASALGGLCAAAFIVGLTAITLLERFLAEREHSNGGKDDGRG